jgi:ATP-binding cassette, subfamily B, bacterial
MTPPPSSGRAAAAALAVHWRAAPVATAAQLALTVVLGLVPAAAAWLTKLLIDEVAAGPDGDPGVAARLALAVAGVAGLLAVLQQVGHYLTEHGSARAVLLAERRLFERVGRLRGLRHVEDPAFHDSLKLATEAAREAPQATGWFLANTTRAAVTVAGLTGAVAVIWAPMALLLLGCAVPALVARYLMAKRESAVAETMAETARRHSSYGALLVDVQAAQEIRLFGLGPLLGGRVVDANRRMAAARLAVLARTAVVQSGFAVITGLVVGLGTVVVVRRATGTGLTPGDLALFLAAVAGIQAAAVGVVLEAGEMVRAVRLFRHYVAVVRSEDTLPDGTLAPAPLRDRIEFHDVWFRYDEAGPWVLRGLSLVVPAGRTTGLVGANGVGKSTLVKLLCRFYDPQRGSITWDGVDLRELRVAELRRRMAVTFQDFTAYDLSVAENIGLGDVDAPPDPDRVRLAAALVGLDEAIMRLPHGYDTVLSRIFADDGAAGTTLSGGQWQRLALARALLREDADLLVLDEPTSGLDPQAERQVQDVVAGAGLGRTRVLVSHRLSALRAADLIVALADGQAVEQGSHDELMALEGRYSTLFRLQAAGYQDRRVAAR